MTTYTTPVEKALEHVFYDETSPSGLRWFESGTGRRADLMVGSPTHEGYWRVSAKCLGTGSTLIHVHRLIWEMHYGPIPDGLIIDHRDGNPANNLISNLRLSDTKRNALNVTGNKGRWLPKGVYTCGSDSLITKISGSNVRCSFRLSEDPTSEKLNALFAIAHDEILKAHGEFANVDSFYCTLPDEAVFGADEGFLI
ncbi:endonuclease [Pseudomonas cichorii]|nr:HNH endonuclease signature motif containing protein [Pseudomonas cichorii]GFM52032.1 endonuclease [Pseudomonas cichorii]